MIAMQYRIVLPADYPMSLIEKRIRDKGHLLNGYPGLIFKAYLYARKDAGHGSDPVNSYAPFYVWQDHQAMMSFLHSEGFAGLCQQFGRPDIQVWYLDGEPKPPAADVAFACIEHGERCGADVTGLSVTAWQPVSVCWLKADQVKGEHSGQVYCVAYVAHGSRRTPPERV